jgi:large repetitive protein
VVALLALGQVAAVSAADQTILGTTLIVRDRGSAAKRLILARAKEKKSPNTIVGAPATGGASLVIAANGAAPSRQTYELPAGPSAATGKPFWSGDTTKGFRYKDAKGENGPVKIALLKLKKGVFQIQAVIDGRLGAVAVLPPNTGTDGCVLLTLGGGDSYSVRFAGGTVVNKGAKLFKIAKVTQEGTCLGSGSTSTTTTTTSPTTTSTTIPASEVTCTALAPLPSGTCAVTQGTAARLLEGDVLAPATIYRGGQVLVDATGTITCVGCDCAAQAPGATRVTCPDGVISPGLINGQDHITFTQNAPATDTGERYEHRHDWRIGSGSHTTIPAAGGASANQIRWGELRFLMGGATSTVGSGGQAGLVRNLDQSNNQGLGLPAVDFDTFPLGDLAGAQITAGCAYPGITTAASIVSETAYQAVAGEGIAASARNELACLTTTANGGQDLALPQTAFMNAVAATPAQLALMAQRGTGMIWSPRSNLRLYGNTTSVRAAVALGVEIALGTEWTVSGSMNMLRELRCADEFNQTYLDSFFSDRDLWRMATQNAASIAAMDSAIGSLAVGKVADIAIFSSATNDAYRAVVAAEPQDVVLVLRGGEPLYGDQALVAALTGNGPCDAVDVCGVQKAACLSSEIGVTLSALQTAVSGTYAAYFCGTPANEPTCIPSRSASVNGSTIYTGVPSGTDNDGDGIPNASDDCPDVFNPIRPMDDGVQADADADGVGDVCDPCPVDANTTVCPPFGTDLDGDGVLNDTDNCELTANADQADADADGKGDVCDACPNSANPGLAGCPATIYQIKNGTIPVGSRVVVSGALVTGKGNNGFFMQAKAGDAGYAGADHSGIFVSTGSGSPFLAAAVGNRVDVAGTVADFFGQIDLTSVSAVTVVNAAIEAPPAPVVATAAEVTTGGSRAAALEAVLVQLGAASITAVNAGAGEFTVNDGAGTVVVDDFLFALPGPTVNQTFASVTGVLARRSSVSKLEPRALTDLPPGAAPMANPS